MLPFSHQSLETKRQSIAAIRKVSPFVSSMSTPDNHQPTVQGTTHLHQMYYILPYTHFMIVQSETDNAKHFIITNKKE